MKGKHFLRRCFITGLLVWLPLWVIYAILRFLINLIDNSFSLLPYQYQPDQIFGHPIPGLGALFTLILIFLTGFIVSYISGHYFVAAIERFLLRIPIIRSIYSAIKQLLDAFTHHQSESFRKVILLEYPRKGIYTIGFQTSNRLQINTIPDELITVFIPTTPLPTAGFVILIPAKEVIELNITIDEAFKMIISLGVVKPRTFEKNTEGCGF